MTASPPPQRTPLAIGVFDSGVGGLSVLTEIRRALPDADLVYVADQGHAPYGMRTLEQLRHRVEVVTDALTDRGCRLVTIACNTASAAALHHLRATRPTVLFVGMEPAIKPAAAATASGRVGVVATAATFQGELFSSVVDRFAAGVEVVTAACPSWVELVERGILHGEEAEQAVAECLRPLVDAQVDVVVLACTHYPALTGVIADVLGPDVSVIDPAPAVAAQTARLAATAGLATRSGTLHLLTTGPVEALAPAAHRLGLDADVSHLALP